MYSPTDKVNTIRVPGRPEPRSAFAARVIIIADLWQQGACGITTGATAATIAGCSLPVIDAARVVLQGNDPMILSQVLGGRLALTAAAGKLRRRVRLIKSFQAASPADRAALGRVVGPATVFDGSVVSAL